MYESQYTHKSHNILVLIYHIECPAKYRKIIFEELIDDYFKQICLEI